MNDRERTRTQNQIHEYAGFFSHEYVKNKLSTSQNQGKQSEMFLAREEETKGERYKGRERKGATCTTLTAAALDRGGRRAAQLSTSLFDPAAEEAPTTSSTSSGLCSSYCGFLGTRPRRAARPPCCLGRGEAQRRTLLRGSHQEDKIRRRSQPSSGDQPGGAMDRRRRQQPSMGSGRGGYVWEE